MSGDSLPTGTVTFLFTDLEGSTRLLGRLGPVAYAQVLESHHRIVREVIAACDGTEISTQGDSFFVVFERAADALSAAARIQLAFASHPWPEGVEPRVRAGIHSTEAVVSSPTGFVGMGVHKAARIAAAGHGGQVLVSAAAHALLRDTLESPAHLIDLGLHRLKDL